LDSHVETGTQAAAHGDALIGIAVVVAVAALMGLGFMRLKQPPLVGFILAGLALGPTGAGVIANSSSVTLLAEMGVVVLLFFIGMELSIRAFVLTLRQAVLVAGGQIIAAMGISVLLAWGSGATKYEAIILGFIIATSSTVVAMKMLDDMGVLRGEAGRVAVGVLIAQDLAVVPMLIFVTSLGGGEIDIVTISVKIGVAVALLAGVLWWFGSHGKLKIPLTDGIEDNVELLALGSLALCFAAAAISGVAELSPVYGAFLAGIVVGNSTLRSRVIPVIEPIQSVLLVVFFLSIGLLIDLKFIWANLWLVLIASLIVIAAKTVLNVVLLRANGASARTALLAGLSMAQIGEFSFVLAAAGFGAGALGYDVYRLAIAVTAVTLLVSPLWISIMQRVQHVASEGLTSYRAALAQAYADEIENVGEGISWAQLRYRAALVAWQKWQGRGRAEEPEAASKETARSEERESEDA
jgi:CPA2 family monovalent cation:H+ antiporter-2